MTRVSTIVIATAVLLAGCRQGGPGAGEGNDVTAALPATVERDATPARAEGEWALTAAPDPTLHFNGADGSPRLTIACMPGTAPLLVNLPGARPVASEERLSFGGGGEVESLVAGTRGDPRRGGVTATGAMPQALGEMLAAGPGASYGASAIGPLPPVEPAMARAFVAACHAQPAAPPPVAGTSACLVQDGKPVAAPALRLVGTEPFWGGRTEGRCVTYSTPEVQEGRRLWTKVSSAAGGWRFAGALGGQPFILTVTPKAGCSDGMSDLRYPYAAELRAGGELRRGCARPL